jgi:lipopolysaccharide export system protein LptA
MCKRRFSILIFLSLAIVLRAQVKPGKPAGRQGSPVTASDKVINVVHAASLSFDQSRNNAKVLHGDVQCEHDGAMLYCDTALIFDSEKKMQASGHILITKGDSIRVTGDKLFYDGQTKLARLENNVKCVEKDMTLTTNFLTFDVGNSIANYYDGGTIVDKENILVSKNGHYYSATKEAAFHYDVVLTNPNYKITSDTLRYRFTNKTAYFFGPSIIVSKTDYIYCENGWYDTGKEKAQFSKNALLITEHQRLTGDSLVYDRDKKTGWAYRNIVLTDTSQKSVLYGNYAEYKQTGSEALVTGKAIYARLVEQDTLFIAADTLYHRDLDSVDNFLNAYHNVRIFKSDLQGIADSASLHTKDSLLQLFKTPLLWANKSQATSKIIKVDIGKNSVNGFHLDGKAFLVEQADSLDKYNQLTGRTIDGLITQDSVRRIIVSGNADVVYYPKNKDKITVQNKTTCSEIYLWFKKGDVDRVTFKPKPEGVIDPIREVDLQNAKLKGFSWQYDRRPKSRFELHERNTPPADENVKKRNEKDPVKEDKKAKKKM